MAWPTMKYDKANLFIYRGAIVIWMLVVLLGLTLGSVRLVEGHWYDATWDFGLTPFAYIYYRAVIRKRWRFMERGRRIELTEARARKIAALEREIGMGGGR